LEQRERIDRTIFSPPDLVIHRRNGKNLNVIRDFPDSFNPFHRPFRVILLLPTKFVLYGRIFHMAENQLLDNQDACALGISDMNLI